MIIFSKCQSVFIWCFILIIDAPYFSDGNNTDDKIWDDYVTDLNSEIHDILQTNSNSDIDPNYYTITADAGYKNWIKSSDHFKLRLPCGVKTKQKKKKGEKREKEQLTTEQANLTR